MVLLESRFKTRLYLLLRLSQNHHSLKFLATQRRALITLRAQVVERLRVITPHDKSDGRDAGDLAVADEQSSLDVNVNEMTYETIRDIDEALVRISKETYGICELTHELIPVERLKALPFARLTVAAQRGQERNRAGRSRQSGVSFDDDPASSSEE